MEESQILYEDNHLLVINKKVGQLVQGDKTGDESLLDSIKNFIKIILVVFIIFFLKINFHP